MWAETSAWNLDGPSDLQSFPLAINMWIVNGNSWKEQITDDDDDGGDDDDDDGDGDGDVGDDVDDDVPHVFTWCLGSLENWSRKPWLLPPIPVNRFKMWI